MRTHDQPIKTGEIVCPASPEGQYKRVCNSCMACDGFNRTGQADVVVIGHGNPSVMSNVQKTLARAAD